MEMKIEFVMRLERSDTTEALREYAVRRLSFAVRRFRHRVRSVTVRLVDVNGPRRGVDTRCSITTDLVEGGQIFVEATAAWPFGAITLAAGRLSEALRRDGSRHAASRGDSLRMSRYGPEGGFW
jgi:putative sigma-54 modulation protein